MAAKSQTHGPERECACGCGNVFRPFPRYVSKGSGQSYPEYMRGHHPRRGVVAGWNRGLTKADHPSIARMGFQPGHEIHNDWSHVNEKLRTDPELRSRWLANKRGQRAWNTGLHREQYPNGIASGAEHGNWAGGHGGLRDTAEYQQFRKNILKRDNYTCQDCGDRNRKGRGRRINLEVDHVVPVCEAPDRVMDPSNVRTLCRSCHFKTETFGSKAARRRRSLGG